MPMEELVNIPVPRPRDGVDGRRAGPAPTDGIVKVKGVDADIEGVGKSALSRTW